MKKFIRISEYLGIDHKKLVNIGVLDSFVNVDSPYYIHPVLLEKTDIPELKHSKEKLDSFFNTTSKLLDIYIESNKEEDYEVIKNYFHFEENKDYALGSSLDTRFGKGLTGKTAEIVINKLIKYKQIGINDIRLYYALSIFNKNIGVDRVSDMLCSILYTYFVEFSDRIYKELGYNVKSEFMMEDKKYNIPLRDVDSSPIILIPSSIIIEIPKADSYYNISESVAQNKQVKDYLMKKYKNAEDQKSSNFNSDDFYEVSQHDNTLVYNSLDYLLKKKVETDFNSISDFYNIINHILILVKDKIQNEKLQINQNLPLFDIVKELINRYKKYVELNGLWRDLYDGAKPRHESTAHRQFYMLSDALIEKYKYNISMEHSSGQGHVDFKFSKGEEIVLVEFKLNYNQKLVNGYNVQLERYMKAEPTGLGIYVVIKVRESNSIKSMFSKITQKPDHKEVIIINGVAKKSPSHE